LLLLVGACDAQVVRTFISTTTVANLPPAATNIDILFYVIDGNDEEDCTVGGGAFTVLCRSTGSVWDNVGSGGGGGGGFNGGTVTGNTYFTSGIPSFDVLCVNSAVPDTQAFRDALNASTVTDIGVRRGPIRIWGDDGCQFNGAAITELANVAYETFSWTTVEQYTDVNFTSSLTISGNHKPMLWIGKHGADADTSFMRGPAANISKSVGNFPIFDFFGTKNQTLSGLTLRGSGTEPTVLYRSNNATDVQDTQMIISNSAIIAETDGTPAIKIIGTPPPPQSTTNFDFTFSANTYSSFNSTTPSIVIVDSGNIAIVGPQTVFLNGGVTIENIHAPRSGNLYISDAYTEAFSGPLVESTGSVNGIFLTNIEFADSIGASYLIKNNGGGAGLGGVYISGNIAGDATGVYDPTSAQIATLPFSRIGQLEMSSLALPSFLTYPVSSVGANLIGLHQDVRRSFGPRIVRHVNLASYTPTTNSGSGTITSTGIPDPTGGTAAHRVVATAGTYDVKFYRDTVTPAVGDAWIYGVWARANTSTGYFNTTGPVSLGTSGSVTVKSMTANDMGQFGTYQDWKYFLNIIRVTATVGDIEVIATGSTTTSTETDFYAPVLVRVTAAQGLSDAEILSYAMSLAPYSPTCSVGDLCNVNGAVISSVSDTAYGPSWNGVTTIAPSKNAVYDQFVATLAGPVATATALAADPADCSAGQATRGINASGVAQNCTNIVIAVANGTIALATASIPANDCATVQTAAATGALSSDTMDYIPNASIKGVTGYTPAGTLTVTGYITADTVNFDVCNKDQSNPVTPGAVTLRWAVHRP